MNENVSSPDGAGTLIRWALGDPLPAVELEDWLAASPTQRAKVAARLHAIRNWPEPGERGVDELKQDLAEAAGLTPKGMRNMVAQWRTAKRERTASLALLGLRLKPRRSPRLKGEEQRALATEIVKHAIARKGEEIEKETKEKVAITRNEVAANVPSIESIVASAEKDERFGGRPPGRNMLREIVREFRIARDGSQPFGAHIIFDEIPLSVCAPSGKAYRAILVIDEATRLCLGASVEAGTPTMTTVREAAGKAADRLCSESFPGIGLVADETRVTVALSDPSATSILRFFAEQPGWKEYRGVKGRLAGPVLGTGLGRVDFRPALDRARGLTECDETIPSISPDEALQLLSLAIERHNASIADGVQEKPEVAARRRSIAQVLRRAARVS